MTKTEITKGLNDLIKTNYDRIKSYRKTAEEIMEMAKSQKKMLEKPRIS